jgi:drug/metabolite transporter (DMT)-like permease
MVISVAKGAAIRGTSLTTGQSSETTRGYLYAILGALCSGSVPTLAKILLTDNGAVVITGLSFLLSGFVLLLYQPRLKPAKSSIPYLIFFGLVGAAIAPLMYTVGLNETTVVNASLLANGEILFTTLIAFTVFGERLSRSQASRGGLIVVGVIIVSTNLDLTHIQFLQGLVGNILVLGSTVGWAVENNIIVLATKRFNVSSISKFRNLIGGGVVTAFVLIGGLPFGFTPYATTVLVLLALALSGGTYLFIAAVKRLGAIRMLLVWSTSTVFGAFFGVVVLGEQITPAQLAGGACILLGVYLFRRSEKPAFVP